jgi:peptidoglycan hydrolase-like protein with peptidoglycan-binding domain
LGYYNGPINGLLDEKTMEAVVKFQVDHNLPAGNISIQTLEALGLNQLAKNYVACELRK